MKVFCSFVLATVSAVLFGNAYKHGTYALPLFPIQYRYIQQKNSKITDSISCASDLSIIGPLNKIVILSHKKLYELISFRWKKIPFPCEVKLEIQNINTIDKALLIKAGSSGIVFRLKDGSYKWRILVKSTNQKITKSSYQFLDILEYKSNTPLLVLQE
jgi:hypothetical protein